MTILAAKGGGLLLRGGERAGVCSQRNCAYLLGELSAVRGKRLPARKVAIEQCRRVDAVVQVCRQGIKVCGVTLPRPCPAGRCERLCGLRVHLQVLAEYLVG